MESPFIALFKLIIRLIALVRGGVREIVLSILYFGVIGPLSLFRPRRRDPFKSRDSTWERINEGSSSSDDHTSKL